MFFHPPWGVSPLTRCISRSFSMARWSLWRTPGGEQPTLCEISSAESPSRNFILSSSASSADRPSRRSSSPLSHGAFELCSVAPAGPLDPVPGASSAWSRAGPLALWPFYASAGTKCSWPRCQDKPWHRQAPGRGPTGQRPPPPSHPRPTRSPPGRPARIEFVGRRPRRASSTRPSTKAGHLFVHLPVSSFRSDDLSLPRPRSSRPSPRQPARIPMKKAAGKGRM